MDDTYEEWKAILDYEGYYEVSSAGRVKRVRGGKGARAGRILSASLDPDGYPKVNLHKASKKTKFFVHSLVATAFLGPRPPLLEVNHIDGDKCNNRPANLEYTTRGENISHAFKIGLRSHAGEKHPQARLSDLDCRDIKILKRHLSWRKLARLFDINSCTLRGAMRRAG